MWAGRAQSSNLQQAKIDRFYFINFTIILPAVRHSFQRSIHVSSNENSRNVLECGTTRKPCHSIQYALEICLDGDTILLDSSSEFSVDGPLAVNKDIRMEVIASGDANIQRNRIVVALLEITNDLT